nr:MAG TPA: hypothetical protein [Caudoviricetes sp.]
MINSTLKFHPKNNTKFKRELPKIALNKTYKLIRKIKSLPCL